MRATIKLINDAMPETIKPSPICSIALGWINRCAALIMILLALQIALGIGNVLLRLPLLLAVAHNAAAALLLAALVMLNFALFVKPPR